MDATMRAAVCVRPGGPEVLEVREVPVPGLRDGWTLVRVRAAGLNRAELRTRQGHSPGVRFPRVLGIECVGEVVATGNPALPAGTTVAAVMGEMGRAFDGGYAEYALLPDELLVALDTTLPWDVLGALPESALTAQGSLDALGLRAGAGQRLLVRGGTSSVGLAAVSLASGYGAEVAATTRRPERLTALRSAGAVHPLLDTGRLADASAQVWPEGPDLVLDLVGAATAVDSLRLVRRGGTVCVSGSLSGWRIEGFEPIAMIPSGTRLTSLHSNDLRGEAGAALLRRVVARVESGAHRSHLDRVFALDDVADAHRYLEADAGVGKVVLVP